MYKKGLMFALISLIILIIIPLSLASNTVTVIGKIQESDGAPIKDVIVRLVDMDNKEINITVTDADGRYQFNDEYCKTDRCSVRMIYPDDNSEIYAGNYYAVFAASGTQTIQTTRLRSHVTKPMDDPVILGIDVSLILSGIIGFIVLGCIYLLVRIARSWRY